jgi:hypothetical protein
MSELINYIDMPIGRLSERGKELTAAINGNYLSVERKAQVQKELGDIAFEMWFRHQDGEFDIVDVAEHK